MVTIGNDTLPGTILTIESSTSAGVNLAVPGTGVIVGPADLTSGSASADTAYEVRTPQRAKNLFGSTSQLSKAIQDALAEGAYPVYAVTPAQTDATDDLSGLTVNTGTLNNAPTLEAANTFVFTINSTQHTAVTYYDGDPHNVAASDIDAEEVYVNPISGNFQIDDGTTVGNASDDVTYTYVDYSGAFDEIETATFDGENLQDIVDFVVLLQEDDTATDDMQTTLGNMESSGALAIGLSGAGTPYIADTSTFTQSYDDSRMQQYYPSRNSDNDTLLGSVLGLRSSLGIDRSPMFKTLDTQDDLRVSLSRTQRENLVGQRVNPLLDQSGGAKVIEDLTTVDTSANTDEANFDQGFARLVVDHIAEFVDAASDPFIGELHTRSARNALRGIISAELKRMLASNSITAFSLVVDKVDSDTASVDVGVKTTDPLRNIEASVLGGAVSSGTGA